MLKRVANYYTQALRIDLMPAAMLCALNPEDEGYREAAVRHAFIICVLQGDIEESVYIKLDEWCFDLLSDARAYLAKLQAADPDAICFDFADGCRPANKGLRIISSSQA